MVKSIYLLLGFVLLLCLFPIIAMGILTPIPFDDIVIFWFWGPIGTFVAWVLQKGRGQ
jgi:hypothetical protein